MSLGQVMAMYWIFLCDFQYLLHYLKFLKDWFDPYTWESVPLCNTSWALLTDSYHSNLALRYKPQHIAISVIQMALQSYGTEVPLQDSSALPWWKVMPSDCRLDCPSVFSSYIEGIHVKSRLAEGFP